jgi:acetyl esterase/lipase
MRKIKIHDGRIQSIDFSLNEDFLGDLKTAILKATQPTYADIAYGEEGGPEQVLDLYLPQNVNPPVPVILMIHGSGDKKEKDNAVAGYFNQAGFVTVMINYR